jgi:hypothetical protein
MDDLLSKLILGLGVFLGVLSPRPDPEMIARTYRTAEALYVSAEIKNAAGNDVETLIEAGNGLSIEMTASVNAQVQKIRHTIVFDPKSKLYVVEDLGGGKKHHTASRDAAILLWATFYHVKVGPTNGLKNVSLSIVVTANISIDAEAPIDSRMLWNFKTPIREFNYANLERVPF